MFLGPSLGWPHRAAAEALFTLGRRDQAIEQLRLAYDGAKGEVTFHDDLRRMLRGPGEWLTVLPPGAEGARLSVDAPLRAGRAAEAVQNGLVALQRLGREDPALLSLLAQAEASRERYQALLSAAGRGAITTEVASGKPFFYAEAYHQQYLAKPGSRPYCSARPSGVLLDGFEGAEPKLPASVWTHYDWSISHCVLRGDNEPIQP
mgnify:CR=1 FL=1